MRTLTVETLINSVLKTQLRINDYIDIKLKPLLTSNNPKMIKSLNLNVQTVGLSLAPAQMNGEVNFCTSASKECLVDCLNLSGRGRMNLAQKARKRKSLELIRNPRTFLRQLCFELIKARIKAVKSDLELVVRLNVLSDIRWELVKVDGVNTIFELFPEVTFYDYTKHDITKRIGSNFPSNYNLVFSYTGRNKMRAIKALEQGHSIAVVYNHKKISMPKSFMGYNTVSGDDHDLVFLHPKSTVLMLTAKGEALKAVNSPFVLGS